MFVSPLDRILRGGRIGSSSPLIPRIFSFPRAPGRADTQKTFAEWVRRRAGHVDVAEHRDTVQPQSRALLSLGVPALLFVDVMADRSKLAHVILHHCWLRPPGLPGYDRSLGEAPVDTNV